VTARFHLSPDYVRNQVDEDDINAMVHLTKKVEGTVKDFEDKFKLGKHGGRDK